MRPKIVLYAYHQMNGFVFNMPHSLFQMALDEPLFTLKIATLDGNAAHTDLGAIIPADGDLSLFAWADMIILSGWHLAQAPDARLMAALQQAHAQGKKLVGLCYGTYGLAYAGLLDGKSASTHWLAEADFSRRFPRVKLDTNRLYSVADNIITSAGAAAGLDCCLSIVRLFHGAKIANQLARILVSAPHRSGGQAQFIRSVVPHSTQDQRINGLLAYLQEHLADSHQIDDLAHRANMSRRTFTRHFQKNTGMSVVQWLLTERLNRSQELLESSRLSIEQIAGQTGFGSATHFRQKFKAKFKVSPSQWRETFGG